MNSLGISTDPTLLSVDLPSSLTTSPSVSTFLPEEEASICPLLPATTPSPPPLDYIHPLTPSTGADSGNVNTESARDCGDEDGDRANAEDTSSSSSGIGIEVNGGPNSIFTKNAYQHLACNLMENMNGHQDDGKKQNGFRGLNRLNISISQETPTFVAWNWPVIRKCTFFMVMSALFAMTALVVSMIVTLPKACNPPVPWWKGSVFYEIFPASFQDSNADGLGDIKGLASRVDYIKNLGVGAIRLNSIFPAKHYPDYFQNVTTLMEIDDVLGTKQDLQQLIATLHANNISLILDLPLYPLIKDLAATDLTSNSTLFNATMDSEDISHSVESNVITDAMRMWLALGVDGFYVKGLEHFEDDPYLLDNVKEWRQLLGADRILIISNNLVKKMDTEAAREVLDQVNLVDVFLDVSNGSAYIASQIKHTIEGILKPGFAPWLQWSLGGVSERRLANGVSQNASLAASLMQLMLPGTPSIFYGDEINLSETHDPHNEHSETKHMHHLATMEWSHGNQFTNRDTLPWLPRGANSVAFHHVDLIQELIKLRERTPSIYQNAVYKSGVDPIPSTSVRYSRNDILILERWYPRRNTFVSISNLGDKILSLNLSAMFYSGVAVVTKSPITDIYFSAFEIGPMETIIVKLHK